MQGLRPCRSGCVALMSTEAEDEVRRAGSRVGTKPLQLRWFSQMQ
jgi:hypothetical protein